MILSIDVRKAFDKIQHPFLIKTLNRVGIEGTYLNIIKAICKGPTSNIILNGEKLRAFPLRLRTRWGCPLSPCYLTWYWESQPQQSNQKEIKDTQNSKEEVKLSLSAYDMILSTENPKDSTKKLLELTIECFSSTYTKTGTIQRTLAWSLHKVTCKFMKQPIFLRLWHL